MQAFLEALLPRIAPGLQFLCVPFEGKADLRRNAARRLRACSDLDGLREAMPHALPASSRVEKFRDPDSLANATQEVERLLRQAPLRKVQTAREIGRVLSPARVTSRSLQTFIASVTRCSAAAEGLPNG